MAQHDPVEDFQHINSPSVEDAQTQEPNVPADFGKPNAHPQQDSSSPYPSSNNNTITHARPLFIHANFPKFDPATIFFYGEEGSARPIIDSNGTAVRAWLPEQQSITYFRYDIERAFWAEVQFVACNWDTMFLAWKDEHNICENVKAYREWVFT
ncbi:MAG: hypothetical protein M1823_008200 [Watsoniomyces obsoletus]|nr:MAG: hypothetical protein M1823_008200 [Watsoniomyces obsoletus]